MAVSKFLLPFATAFTLALVGAIRLTIAGPGEDAPVKSAASGDAVPANAPAIAKPDASNSGSNTSGSDVVLADEQAKLSQKYKELERVVLRMAEVMQSSDPRRAALLRQAFAQSRERQIGTQFDDLVKLLQTDQLYQASKGQTAVDQDLNRLLQLLMSGDRDKQIPNERAEIKRFIERINKLIREQQGIEGETEGQGDQADLANRQEKLANRTTELAKDLHKFDERNNPNANDPSNADNADGKDAEGKDGDAKDADGKKADGKKSDGKKSDAKKSDGKNADGKDAKGDDQKGENAKGDVPNPLSPRGSQKSGSKNSDGKQSGSKDGKSDAKSGEKGDEKADNADDKNADGKDGEKANGEKSGGEKSGEKSNGSKSGSGSKSDKKGANSKSGKSGQKSNQNDAGKNAKSADEKSDDGKSGDEKPKDEKSNDQKSDDQKSDEQKSGGEKSDGKSGQKSSKSGGKSGQKSQQSKKGGKDSKDGDESDEQSDPQNGDQQQQDEQSNDEPPARKQIRQAEDRMRDAKRKLEEAERRGAAADQQKAIEELKQAKAALEEILRQLREEEVERVLAMLEGRFRKMLQLQVEVYEGTIALDRIPEEERDRNTEIESDKLSKKEANISAEADKTLTLLREEGSSVAFPESVEQLREDMDQVTARLHRTNIGSITQGVEQDIVKSLEEMVAALQKAQKEQQKGAQQKGGKKGGGQPQDKPLVNAIAELKMIRALQMRVNMRTERYSKLLADGTEQAEAPDLVEAVKRLSEREERIHKTTRDIVVGRNK
jgi:hypothetical protein